MTTRERILIAAMAGAAVWGGSTLGLDAVRRHHSGRTALLRQAEIQAFADAHHEKARMLRLNDGERRALDQAAADWAPSPFIDRASLATAVEVPVEQFAYTGFIQAGDRRFAIVNGREYRVEEPVAQTDFRVEAIHADHVVLVSASGGRRLTIAMQAQNEKRNPK